MSLKMKLFLSGVSALGLVGGAYVLFVSDMCNVDEHIRYRN